MTKLNMLALTETQKNSAAQDKSRHQYFGFRFLFFWFLLPFSNSFSQYRSCDSLPGFSNTLYRQYFDHIGAAAHLYNGAEYEGSYIGTLGNPFWNSSQFQTGSVSYDGVVYYDVPLAFDLVRKEILTKTLQPAIIRLETSKVQCFCINQHRFVVISNDTTAVNPLPDDIYDLALDKPPVRLLIKRSKEIRHSLYVDNKDSIVALNKYFIQYGNRNYFIKNSRQLLEIFYRDKKGFRALWKQEQLNFKKDPEAFIIQSLQFWIEQRK
ncbi:MAG: hypothetical protein ACXVLT_14925 [Flavisolibacter sp.]